MAARTSPRSQERPVVGWREWVSLPALCEEPIKAKIDTGARTSSLHAFDLTVAGSEESGCTATFDIHPAQRSTSGSLTVTHDVSEFRTVRSSSGHTERRPVIRTIVRIGEHHFPIDLTLTSRDEMGFRMLLGRAAVRRHFLVDPARSFRQGEPR